jgi:hypothetical protein
MDEMDGGAQLLLLERQIAEVETRLGMLGDQILAICGEGSASGEQAELVCSALKALQALTQLRRELREDAGQAAPCSLACAAPRERPQENQPAP